MNVITDWSADKAGDFTRAALGFHHDLHERTMFDDAGLVRALDLYPRERLGVFTMGADPVDWRSWRRGAVGALSGDKLLEAARAGRIWLNLRETNRFLPEYAALCGEIFADKAAHVPGLRTFRRDVGLLISSANAQVFYHLDVPLVSLWQLRGNKRVWLYPVADPFVGDEQLERIILRETAEQFAYEPAWDAAAAVFDLTPGDMITWPQNAPHRIENGDMLNVSLSVEFMTPAALMRANVIYANGVLRRTLGLKPVVQQGLHPAALGKLALARTIKAMGLRKTFEARVAPSFALDPARPGRLVAAPA